MEIYSKNAQKKVHKKNSFLIKLQAVWEQCVTVLFFRYSGLLISTAFILFEQFLTTVLKLKQLSITPFCNSFH